MPQLPGTSLLVLALTNLTFGQGVPHPDLLGAVLPSLMILLVKV